MRRSSWYTRRCWGGWVCSACRRERCLCRGEIYLLSASYEWGITEKIESDSSPCLKRTNQSFSFSPHTPRVPGPDHFGGLCRTCSCLLIALLRWRDSKLDTALQVQPPQREAGRNNNFSHSAVCAFADVNRNAVWRHTADSFNFLFTRTLGLFLQSCFPVSQSPACPGVRGYFIPGARVCHCLG